jgi:hypothetical protein
LATKLGVDVQPGDENLAGEELTQQFIARAKEAGKSSDEINQALSE